MKTPVLALLTLALAAPLPAAAQSAAAKPNVSAAFGNTVVSTYPDGRKGHLWINADGTYTATGRRKKPSSGVWTVKGAKICLKQKKPSPAPFSYCTTAPASGKSWTAKAVTGERITVQVVPGVVKG